MKYLNAQAKKDLFILSSYVDFASAYAKNLNRLDQLLTEILEIMVGEN